MIYIVTLLFFSVRHSIILISVFAVTLAFRNINIVIFHEIITMALCQGVFFFYLKMIS